jgi:hypothetical protein
MSDGINLALPFLPNTLTVSLSLPGAISPSTKQHIPNISEDMKYTKTWQNKYRDQVQEKSNIFLLFRFFSHRCIVIHRNLREIVQSSDPKVGGEEEECLNEEKKMLMMTSRE